MKLFPVWLLLLVGLSACVSDDSAIAAAETQPTLAVDAEVDSSQSPESVDNSAITETTQPAEEVGAAQAPETSESTVPKVERVQGKPITVTTVEAAHATDAAVRSNVQISNEWCKVSEDGELLALAQVQNSEALAGDFILEFEVLDPYGVRVGEGLDVVHDVKAGQDFVSRDAIDDPIGWEGDMENWTCRVLRVSTPDAVLALD